MLSCVHCDRAVLGEAKTAEAAYDTIDWDTGYLTNSCRARGLSPAKLGADRVNIAEIGHADVNMFLDATIIVMKRI